MSSSYQTSVTIAASSTDVFKLLATTEGIQAWWTKYARYEEGKLEAYFPKADFHARFKDVKRDEAAGQLSWECFDSMHSQELNYKNPKDWVGTKVFWTLTAVDFGSTKLELVHDGLTEELECWKACTGSGGWPYYVQSLKAAAENTDRSKYHAYAKEPDYANVHHVCWIEFVTKDDPHKFAALLTDAYAWPKAIVEKDGEPPMFMGIPVEKGMWGAHVRPAATEYKEEPSTVPFVWVRDIHAWVKKLEAADCKVKPLLPFEGIGYALYYVTPQGVLNALWSGWWTTMYSPPSSSSSSSSEDGAEEKNEANGGDKTKAKTTGKKNKQCDKPKQVIGSVNHLEIVTADIETTVKLYTDLFGWSFNKYPGMTGEWENCYFFSIGEDKLGGHVSQVDPKHPGREKAGFIAYTNVESVQAALDIAKSKHNAYRVADIVDAEGHGWYACFNVGKAGQNPVVAAWEFAKNPTDHKDKKRKTSATE